MRVRSLVIHVGVGLVLAGAACHAAEEHVPVIVQVSDLADRITVIEGIRSADSSSGMVRSLRDINGDGCEDIAFWGTSGSQETEGSAYIWYGTRDLPRTATVTQWNAAGIRLHSPYGQRLPMALAGLGDLDGDGYGDMAFTSCFPVFTGAECPAYILFGGQSLPRDIDTSKFEGCRGCPILLDGAATEPGIQGFAVGDVNGDGVPDLLFAATRANLESYPPIAGVAYLVLGSRPFPASIDLSEVGATVPGCKITSFHGGEVGVSLGWQVSMDRDFNGDGMADLVIAAHHWYCADGIKLNCGSVFVVFGRQEWPALLDVDLEADRARGMCWIRSITESGALGQFVVEGTDDLTNDGAPDLLVSWKAHSTYLISGSALKQGTFSPAELAFGTLSGVLGMDLLGHAIGDWNDDGLVDFASGSPGYDPPVGEAQDSGCVFLVPGRSEYPQAILPVVLDCIVGATPSALFGKDLVAADVNGDGKKDLVVSAPGPSAEESLCSLYVIPHGTELLGALRCDAFVPNLSTLAGGARFYVTGAGFDARTRVFIGATELEVEERPHSGQLIARIPAVAEAGAHAVRVVRGEDEYTFTERFTYYESIWPRELDVRDLGVAGCTLAATEGLNDYTTRFVSHSGFEGGEDITGDGLADVVVPQTWGLARVILLHGARNLPPRIDVPNESPAWATTFVKDPLETLDRDGFGSSAVAVGDMNGDGTSELAILDVRGQRVYIVYGGELPKGIVAINDLLDAGRCAVVEDCPYGGNTAYRQSCEIVKLGDVNGDGLADLGIAVTYGTDAEGNPRGAVAFVLGSRGFPAEVHYGDLPKLYGLKHSVASTFVAVRGAGDLDGDGFDDMAVFAVTRRPQEPGDDPETACMAVFFGRSWFPQTMTIEEELLNGGACRILDDDEGAGVNGIGDVNGDGLPDIGLFFGTILEPSSGRFRVIYGGSRARLCKARSSTRDSDFDVTFRTVAGYNAYIYMFGGGGDLNADGYGDILLCDQHTPADGDDPPSRAICVFGGNLEAKAGQLDLLTDCLELVNAGRFEGHEEYARYPVRFDFAGDVNGDGYEDLVVYDMCQAYIYFNPLGALKGVFIRGDANQDARIDIADAIRVLSYLFGGAKALPCMDAGDANDDETVNIADAIRVLGFLFGSGEKPLLPPPNHCGPDPQGETLGCADSVCK